MASSGSSTSPSSDSTPAPSRVDSWARRIDGTTGKEHLKKFCAAGFGLEFLWQTQVERRLLGTPAPAVRHALLRAAIVWPSVYVVARISFKWAAGRVARTGGASTT